MRIWVLSTEYKPNIIGGLGVVATELTEAMRMQGATVSVLSMCHQPRVLEAVRKSLNITRFPNTLPYFSKRLKLYHTNPIFPLLAQRRRPDAIHIHSVEFTEVAHALHRRWGIPLVYTCHSLVPSAGNSKRNAAVADSQERLLSFADTVVVPSQWLKQRLCAMYPSCQRKVRVIPNGVQPVSRAGQSSRYGLLYVGRMIPVKGVEQLLGAIAILKDGHPQVRLDLAGTGSARYMASLRQLAKGLKVEGYVRWLGFIPSNRLSHLYRTHGAVVFPSREESFGLVAMEAFANGVPLVSTRAGGLGEFVNSDAASIIKLRSPAGIARAIRDVWQSPRTTALRVRQGERIAARFTWNHVAAEYCKLFRQLTPVGRR